MRAAEKLGTSAELTSSRRRQSTLVSEAPASSSADARCSVENSAADVTATCAVCPAPAAPSSSSRDRRPVPKVYASSSGAGSGNCGNDAGGGGGGFGISRTGTSALGSGFGAFAITDVTMAINGSGGTNGFLRMPSAPTRRASASSSGSNAPTKRITGIFEKRGSFLINSQTS